MNKNYQKILLIKLQYHGDMLLTTPVINTLKYNYPEAQIDILLNQETKPILSENNTIHALYGVVGRKASFVEKIKNTLSLIKILRKNRYDLIINLADRWLVSLLVRLIPAQTKISHQFPHRRSHFWEGSFDILVPLENEHVVKSNLSVLKPLNLPVLIDKTTMSYNAEHWLEMSARLQTLNIDPNAYVVVQPTSRKWHKCWNDEKFAQVIDYLHDKGLQVVITSGPSEEDLACVNNIAQFCHSKPNIAFAGKTTFPELAALIDHAVLFFGVDSAPMHMAAALNTPQVCLFGTNQHKVWLPWSDNAEVIWAGDYHPIPVGKGLDEVCRFLSYVPATDVIAAVDRMFMREITK